MLAAGLILATFNGRAQVAESRKFSQYMQFNPARNNITVASPVVDAKTIYMPTSTSTNKINDVSDIRIFPTSNLQISPSISINKQNPNNIVISAETYNPSTGINQGYFYTANGGSSWSGAEQMPNNPLSFGGKPHTSFNKSNRAFVLGEAGQDGGFFLQSSTNGGSVWGSQTWYFNIVDDVLLVNMTTDNESTSPYADRYYGVWTLANGGGGVSKKVNFHKSTDNGIYFTPPNPDEVVLKVGYNLGPNVQTGPNGEVYVCWSDRSTATPFNSTGLGFCKSLDGGITFNAYQKVLNYQGIYIGAVANPIYNNTVAYDHPSMAVDKSPLTSLWSHRGRIYVAVTTKENGNGKSIIQLSYSDNQGASWSPLNTISIPAGRQNWYPYIAIDDCTGEVWVIYYSFDTASGFTTNTYVARSTDGGVTWENQKISDVGHITAPVPNSTIYAGYQLGITAYGGKAHAVWSDNRAPNPNWQLYYSPVTGSSESNINGFASMCGTSIYNLTGIPLTAAVTWTVNTTSPQVTLVPNGQSVVVSTNGYLGTFTLSAAVVNGCGTYRFTKQVQAISGTTLNANNQVGTWIHVNGSTQPMADCNLFPAADVVLPCPDGVIDPCYYQARGSVTYPGTTVNYALVASSSTAGASLSVSGNTFTVTCRRIFAYGYVTVRCTTSNGCSSVFKDHTFYVTPNYCHGNNAESKSLITGTTTSKEPDQQAELIISPNPSTGQFTLNLSTTDKNSLIKEVIITDKMGKPLYHQKFFNSQKTQIINLFNQPTDTYMVQLFDGKEWHTQKLLLRK